MARSLERREIGTRLKAALRRAGYGQNALARRLGKVNSAISGWVSGRTQPDLETLAEICQLTGISADELLGLAAAAPGVRVDRLLGRIERMEREVQKKLQAETAALRNEVERLKA